MREKEYKIEGKQVLYFNGVKWLVKETCKTKKEAKELLELLLKRQNVE